MKKEKGFVLPTVLMLLLLMTMISLSISVIGITSLKVASSARSASTGYYYAESAINYIAWAWENDAELDSYPYTGGYTPIPFTEPRVPYMPEQSVNSDVTGDYTELTLYQWRPGPTIISDTMPDGVSGQVRYFDNTPMSSRFICTGDNSIFNQCMDFSLTSSMQVHPSMYKISSKLPRYIKLEIGANGSISPTIPRLPHRANPVVGEDIPFNGAIVWITGGDQNGDVEIFSLDPSLRYGGVVPNTCVGDINCPCNVANTVVGDDFTTAQACNSNTGKWIDYYGIVVYAIGYVDGVPTKLLRVTIM